MFNNPNYYCKDMNKQEIQKLLQHAEQEAVYSFILTYAKSNAEFCKQLKTALMPKGGDSIHKEAYLAKAENCFDFEGGQGWQSRHYNFYQAAYDAAAGLDSMLSDADYLIEQRKYGSAASILMSVIEVIPPNYGCVDDSSGTLGNTFNMATDSLVDMIYDEQVPERLKKDIYEWIKQEMNNSVYSDYGFDSLIDVYEAACEELGETDEILADLDKQIEAAKDYQKEYVVLRKIRFMQSRNLDTNACIDKYLEIDAIRKMRFDQLMESQSYDDALVLARKGIEIANTENHSGTVTKWENSILKIYLKQGDVKKILLLAEKLLSENRFDQSEYYQILKEYTNPGDWTATLERILGIFEKSSYFSSFAAKVMIEHQMWKRLFTYCKKRSDIATRIEEYESYLKPHFEKEILNIYHAYVEKQALITDSSAYDRVARMLKRMRTFNGGDTLVNQLLQEYRSTYKRRKNMMAALQNV